MNTQTEPVAGRAVAAPAKARQAQSPLEFFENHAKTVWRSDLSPVEKSMKLYSISDSIEKYLRKTKLELVERARSQDKWQTHSCSRATSYLSQLAVDLRDLAIHCQQKASSER